MTLQFLAEWALRSSILILTGTLLLGVLRVKDPLIHLTALTAMLCGSLAIPGLTAALPAIPLMIQRAEPRLAEAPVPVSIEPVADVGIIVARHTPDPPNPFDWQLAGEIGYALVALTLLLRLCVGLAMSLRLRRNSRPTGQRTEGIEILESDRVTGPITLGIARPAIVLPADWHEWDTAKIEAVLTHERSHVRRYDPAVQLLSAIHRSLLWITPLSWFLHTRIVRTAEEASDDAAMAVNGDRAFYAQVLLDFMQRGAGNPNRLGVPMARYAHPNQRIHRILDGTAISRGITRWTVVAIVALTSPVAYVVAAAHPQSLSSQSRARKEAVTEPSVAPAKPTEPTAPQIIAPSPKTAMGIAPAYLTALGNVTAFYTVTIKARIDGELMSVGFKEGEEVEAGQVLASVDSRSLQLQLAQAESQMKLDRPFAGLSWEEKKKNDQFAVDNAKLQLSYAQITSPIAGVAGLRLVDPGNMIHAGDSLVVITQLHPIAILFNIPEDKLRKVREGLKKDVSVRVEAWNRQNTGKIAVGHLTAIDNQIDLERGTVKLKAEFDNKDDALFPNQFVNVRLFSNP